MPSQGLLKDMLTISEVPENDRLTGNVISAVAEVGKANSHAGAYQEKGFFSFCLWKDMYGFLSGSSKATGQKNSQSTQGFYLREEVVGGRGVQHLSQEWRKQVGVYCLLS